MNVAMLLINNRRSYFQVNIGRNGQGNEIMAKQVMYAKIQVPRPHVSDVIQSKTHKGSSPLSIDNAYLN